MTNVGFSSVYVVFSIFLQQLEKCIDDALRKNDFKPLKTLLQIDICEDVKIKCSTPVEAAASGGVQPHGIFNPHALTGGDHTTYFLSSNNTLYWPSANGTINGFRVYVHIDPSTPLGNALYHGAPMRIREADNSATGIGQVPGDQVQCAKVLRNGQIVIIRDGREYNAQGIRLQ